MGENARASRRRGRPPPSLPPSLPLRSFVRAGGSFQIYIDVLNHIELFYAIA